MAHTLQVSGVLQRKANKKAKKNAELARQNSASNHIGAFKRMDNTNGDDDGDEHSASFVQSQLAACAGEAGGFEVLTTWMKECMIQQNAYVWRGWVENERVSIEEYEDLTPDEFIAVMGDIDGEYEFLEAKGFKEEDGKKVRFAKTTGDVI